MKTNKEKHMALKPWNLISSRLDNSFRIFNLRTDRSMSPRTGKKHDFYIMESSDWVNVIPLTHRNEVLLVRQFRHGIKEITLEIPGGIVEKGDAPVDTKKNRDDLYKVLNLLGIKENQIMLHERYHSMILKKKGKKHAYF